MQSETVDLKKQIAQSDWYKGLSKYEKPNVPKATWQILNTFIPYFALWAVMVRMLQVGVSFWYILPIAAVAAGLLARIFIFFHDCCHGSFFASRTANKILGFVSGVLVFTPHEDWRRTHSQHHSSSGDLDRRGNGDVWTMTTDEYLAASKLQRFTYRLFRSPPVLFVIAPLFMFMLLHRFPHKGAGRRERHSVMITNFGILGVVTLACATIGWRTYLMVQVPIVFIAFGIGVWLFYVQHQFEDDYWEHHGDWDPMRAALEGSSYYKLPKVLQWFTGNIGLHHVHHLRPGIPNYNLQQALDETPALQEVPHLTLLTSLKSLFLHLWDEKTKKLVGFGWLRTHRRASASATLSR